MASPNLIIGLGHRKRVGKDTFAEMLEVALERLGYDVHRLAFAEALKESAHDLFQQYGLRGARHYELHPEHREQPLWGLGKTPRQIWIEFGNAMRHIDPDLWVNLVKRRIESAKFLAKPDVLRPDAFIISDVRYPNEFQAIRTWGGLLIKIIRPDAPASDDVADCALQDYCESWDWEIINDSDFTWLATQARMLASSAVLEPRHLWKNT